MNQPAKQKIKIMLEKRDQRVVEHLAQYAPVWLENDQPIPEEDAVQFTVVFTHPRYGWVKRRYHFDSYSGVLYHKGQVVLDEDKVLAVTGEKPYLEARGSNPVNSYGG